MPSRWFVAIALALVPVGCGDSRPDGEPPVAVETAAPVVTEAERAALQRYEQRIQRHCVRMARTLVDPRQRPTPEQERRAFAAADALIALATAKPTADLGAGQDLRLLVADIVENLEGSNCDPRMRERLLDGLRSIPRE